MKALYIILSTWFGIGFFPKIPGTIGSLGGFILVPIVLDDFFSALLLCFLLFVISLWVVSGYLCYTSDSDPKEVVIDEVLGQILTFTFSDFLIKRYHFIDYTTSKVSYYVLLSLMSFLFFRFFDIVKVWPINIIDKKIKGALGIILDDILAAVFSVISIIFLLFCCVYCKLIG